MTAAAVAMPYRLIFRERREIAHWVFPEAPRLTSTHITLANARFHISHRQREQDYHPQLCEHSGMKQYELPNTPSSSAQKEEIVWWIFVGYILKSICYSGFTACYVLIPSHLSLTLCAPWEWVLFLCTCVPSIHVTCSVNAFQSMNVWKNEYENKYLIHNNTKKLHCEVNKLKFWGSF